MVPNHARYQAALRPDTFCIIPPAGMHGKWTLVDCYRSLKVEVTLSEVEYVKSSSGLVKARHPICSFVSEAVVPVHQLPAPLRAISPWLPLFLGIEALKRLEAGGNLGTPLSMLPLQSSILLVAGLLAFESSLKRALKFGFGMRR